MSDIFTARTSAWRAEMQRGEGGSGVSPVQLPTTAAVDDHDDGMTHSCSGCAGGEPCGSCGGNISKTHPAYQALGWGLATASPALDPQWRAAHVAQALRDAAANSGDGAWTAIESMVRRVAATYLVAQQGGNAVSALLGAWPPVGIVASDDGRGGGGGGIVFEEEEPDHIEKTIFTDAAINNYDEVTPEPLTGNARRCCGILYYPDKGPLFRAIKNSSGGAEIGPYWEAYYEADPASDDNDCDCNCCTFYQFIGMNEFTITPRFAGGTRQQQSYRNQNDTYGPFSPSSIPTNWSWDDIDALWASGIGIGTPTEAFVGGDKCIYRMRDYPSAPVPANYSWHQVYDFVGVLWDVCRDVEVEHGCVSGQHWGWIEADGKVVLRHWEASPSCL